VEVETRLFGCLGRRFSLTDERRFQQTHELARHLDRSARMAVACARKRVVAGAAVVHPRWAHV
jgi:hypothetical protein